MSNSAEANRPLRVLDKVLQGGLGSGNLGVVMSRHGTGKVAVLTSIAIDHALNGVQTLHVAIGKSVTDIRAYDDEVLSEMMDRLGVQDRAETMTHVERHKQIYTYADGFSSSRLRDTLEFLKNHGEFRPGLIEIQGWPEFETVDEDELRAFKGIAVEFNCEIWFTAHTHRSDQAEESAPSYISRFEDVFSVVIALEPVGEQVNLNFVKTHDAKPPEGINLEFDPKSMLIRWR